MYDPLVALTGGTGLIGVDPGDQDQLILYLFVDLCKTADIVADGIFIICGAGTDDYKKFIAFSGEYITDLLISFFL